MQLAQRILNLNAKETEGINFLRNISIEELKQIPGIRKSKSNSTQSSRRVSQSNDFTKYS